jgi:hypothetical protein
VTGYRRGDRGLIPGGTGDFYLLHSLQTCSGAHPASSSVGTVILSPGVKRPGREPHHSPPSIAEVKNGGAIHPLPLCLHGEVLN